MGFDLRHDKNLLFEFFYPTSFITGCCSGSFLANMPE